MSKPRIYGRVFQRQGRRGWYVRIREQGKPEITVKAKKARSKTEALAFLEAIRQERFEESIGGRRQIESIGFEAWAELYLEQIVETHAAHTVTDYRSKLRRILPAFRGKLLEDVRPQDIERFLAGLRGVKASTRNRYQATLSSLFARAVAQGYAYENPVRGIARVREEKRPVPYLSHEDQDRLVATCPGELRSFVRLAMETGLRRGELARLEWRDIDLARAVLQVRKAKSKQPREVPLTPMATGVLVELRVGRTVPLEGPDLVFSWRERVMGPKYAAFKRAAAVVGQPDLRVHDLRHIFGSTAAQAGVPLPDLQKIMGHATMAMTMRYAEHCPENVASRVGSILARARGTSGGTNGAVVDGSA